MRFPVPPEHFERFYDKTIPVPPSDCLLWTGSADDKGYGNLTYQRKSYKAYRWIRQAVDEVIYPRSIDVMHICDTPLCVALHHLVPGTHADNIADMNRKGRNGHSNKTECKWGHPYDEQNTYYMPSGGRDCKQCVRDRGAKYRAKRKK